MYAPNLLCRDFYGSEVVKALFSREKVLTLLLLIILTFSSLPILKNDPCQGYDHTLYRNDDHWVTVG